MAGPFLGSFLMQPHLGWFTGWQGPRAIQREDTLMSQDCKNVCLYHICYCLIGPRKPCKLTGGVGRHREV